MKNHFGLDFMKENQFPDKQVKSLIKRRKTEFLPAIAELTLDNMDQYEFPDNFYTSNVKLDLKLANETKNSTLLFYNDQSLNELAQATRILVDGTFPRSIYKQLFVLNAIKNNRISTPICVFMSSKSWKEYNLIGLRLTELMQESNLNISTYLYVRLD